MRCFFDGSTGGAGSIQVLKDNFSAMYMDSNFRGAGVCMPMLPVNCAAALLLKCLLVSTLVSYAVYMPCACSIDMYYANVCAVPLLPAVNLQIHSRDGLMDLIDLKQSLPSLAKLKELLENGDIVKVLHDCRQDAEQLYTHHAIKIRNVFDTKVGGHLAEACTITSALHQYRSSVCSRMIRWA